MVEAHDARLHAVEADAAEKAREARRAQAELQAKVDTMRGTCEGAGGVLRVQRAWHEGHVRRCGRGAARAACMPCRARAKVRASGKGWGGVGCERAPQHHVVGVQHVAPKACRS